MHYVYTTPKIQNYRQRPAYTLHLVYEIYLEKTAFSIEIGSCFFGFGIFGTGCCFFCVENEHMYDAGSVNLVNV